MAFTDDRWLARSRFIQPEPRPRPLIPGPRQPSTVGAQRDPRLGVPGNLHAAEAPAGVIEQLEGPVERHSNP